MSNQYSWRRIEKLLKRDIHYIWLSGYEKPDFVIINRFRNRVKSDINNIFTQLVLLLAEKGLYAWMWNIKTAQRYSPRPTGTLSYGARQWSETVRN